MASRTPERAPSRQALEPAEVAWLAAVPCALLTVAAMVLLGPPLGRALLAPGSEAFWPATLVRPEPAEHGRYLFALLGPLLLAAIVVASARGRRTLPASTTRALTTAAQGAACALLVAALLAQNNVIWHAYNKVAPWHQTLTPTTLAVAAALVLVAVAALRRQDAAERIGQALRDETSRRRVVCLLLAVLFTALWLTTAINSDATIGKAQANHLIPWDMNETFAVLDGRTPLVDFHAQYAQLWPYAAAAIMALAGSTTITLWTTIMASFSGLALLAVFGVFRRVARSSVVALALYLPFLATSFFIGLGPAENRFSPAGIFSAWPLRYAGPYLLVWLTARHLDGHQPRRAWLLFVAAGLVVLNNTEFGIAAFAATFAALALRHLPRSRQAALRLLGVPAAGLLGAGLLVALLTLARTGALPDLGLLFEFPRIYAVGGWVMQPMPTMGLHIAVYVTFVAALVLAAVRVARGEQDQLLTSLLAWAGVFGLLAGVFYVGRSEPLQLIILLSAWCFALSLQLIVVVRSLAARGWRRPSMTQLAVLFGFGLAVCSLPQLPTPWSQIERLRHRESIPIFHRLEVTHFVAEHTRQGDPVAILTPLGHRIAYDLGLTNVVPYSSVESMPTKQQVQETLDVMRRARVHSIFLSIYDRSTGDLFSEVAGGFTQAGFAVRARGAEVVELSDVEAAPR